MKNVPFRKQRIIRIKRYLMILSICALLPIYLGFASCNTGSSELTLKASIPSAFSKVKEIPVPEGFKRAELADNSYGNYLRNFPLKQNETTVYLYNGVPKRRQDVQLAILDLEIGKRDLQQCADVAMHLRADYLWKQKQYDAISFDFVSGKKARYKTYVKGDYSRG